MKRFLSLILVLAVVFSMCTIDFVANAAATSSADGISDDFQATKPNSSIWSSNTNTIGIAPIDSDAGNGNKSYKMNTGNLQSTYALSLTKAVLDFDMYIVPNAPTADYGFLSLYCIHSDGVSDDLEGNYQGMLKYFYSSKTIGVNAYKNSSGSIVTAPTGATANFKEGAWNNLKVVIDMTTKTFRVVVNGKLLSSTSGQVDFGIPISNNAKYVSKFKFQTGKNAGLTNNLYYDNVSLRNLTSDISVSSASSILNGEQNAPISALLTYEFTEDILPLTKDDISLKKGATAVTIKEVVTNSDKLSIRLNSKLAYNTEYSLDFSKVMTLDGAYLPASEQIVSFKTKAGSRTTIIEEDFETVSYDTTIWRDGSGKNEIVINPVDSANGNYSCNVKGTNLDMVTPKTANQYALRLKDKVALDFRFLAYNVTSDYNALSLTFVADGKDNLATDGTGMFLYSSADNTFGVHQYYDEGSGRNFTVSGSGSPAVVKLKKNEWNNVRVLIDMNTKTFSIIVNGTILANQFGNSEFKLPLKTLLDDVNQEYSLAGVALQGRKIDGIYFDDICYTNIVEENEAVSDITYNEGEAKVSITKNIVGSSLPKKVMLSVASYMDNELVALATEDFTLAKGETKEYSVKLNDFNGGTVRKVFLWSIDADNITPIKAIK